MKVAIIGAGLSGLACALELEKKGILPDVFEKDNNIGWAWAEVSFWPNAIYNYIGNPMDYLKNHFDIDVKPLTACRTNIIKSPNKEMIIQSDLGFHVPRGKGNESIENQILLQLRKTPVYYNTPTDYKELVKKYDWVVLATGRDIEARELNVWQDEGTVHIVQAIAIGNFDPDTSCLYFNTEYAGTGFARITPFNSVQAVLSLYIIGKDNCNPLDLFQRFIQTEGLGGLDLLYTFTLPAFHNGRVNKTQIGNILLSGRCAGLIESLVGTGSVEALVSGVLAARAIADGQNYEEMVKPLQNHRDNISAMRKLMSNYQNEDFDKLISLLKVPGIKQLIYHSNLPLYDLFGRVLRLMGK